MKAKERDRRTLEQLREHYQIEKELANRLRNASREERRHLYATVYEELFRRVPLHPLLIRKTSPEESDKAVAAQMKFLCRFLAKNHAFLEIGPGDCALSFAVARLVKRVYAIDVSSRITEHHTHPVNFELRLSNGCSIDLPANSIDLAYSNQLIEHLHPEDALEQLQNIHRVLTPGGIYICITPNRLGGPYDISRYFGWVAMGFHLREYTVTDLNALFHQGGFSSVSAYLGVKGAFVRLPIRIFRFCEVLLNALPYFLRRVVANNSPFRLLMTIRLVGRK